MKSECTGLIDNLVPAKAGAGPWSFMLPGVPPSANEQLRMHWSKVGREAKRWHWWLKIATRGIPAAKEHRTVTITRYGHGLLDEGDNLAASYKFVRDLLRPDKVERGIYGPKTKTPGKRWIRVQAGTGLILGDGPGEARFVYQQVKVGKKEPVRTVIVIEVTQKD